MRDAAFSSSSNSLRVLHRNRGSSRRASCIRDRDGELIGLMLHAELDQRRSAVGADNVRVGRSRRPGVSQSPGVGRGRLGSV